MNPRWLVITLLVLSACGKDDKNPVIPVPVPRNPIVFSSTRDGNPEIYVLNPDSTNPVRLTHNPANEGEPAWSPDGTRIAFVSDRDGDSEIYVMNSDSTGQTRVTFLPGEDGHPAWSPDGSKIAFVSKVNGNAEVYVMSADGSDTTNVTKNPASDEWPTWSPDGSRIAFQSNRGLSTDIYVVNADGSNPIQLTDTRWWSAHPAPGVLAWNAIRPDWSPNGGVIAFVAWDGGPMAVIQTMGENGSAHSPLTQNWDYDTSPAWSPDGRLAFASYRDGNLEIYIMNANGTQPVRLTNHAAVDDSPDWKPQR